MSALGGATKYPTYKDCPDRGKHTGEGPEGYLAWHQWADEHKKTHRQRRCPTCGFFVMLEANP